MDPDFRFITGTLENYFWGFIVVFMILLINVFTYYLYDKAKENMEKQMREEILKISVSTIFARTGESKEWGEELRKLRHNMKQHYILENTYLEKEDYEALKRYCSENLKFLDKKILFPIAEIFILTVWLITRQIWRKRQE